MATSGSTNDTITLYTSHRCPWAHRAHIALNELKVPFKEVIIDLDTPRTAEYLAINPRGLVPSINWNGNIITESAIVAQFLADAYPSHLLPPSTSPDAALRRARINFFVDTFFTKFQNHLFKVFSAKSDQEIDDAVNVAVAGAVKEVEPLLFDASPFFGRSDELTLAEVLTGSFVVRLITLAKADVYPSSILEKLSQQTPNFYKWAEIVAQHPSVTSIFDAEAHISSTKARIAKLKA
ncbi:hypothetical protein HK100_003278 [Physocladia obscura]|uniref:Glutathione S-transferase n=1 Tax=Physocladia obscura TaxID=109957 RepID=A0AAD5SVU0_9FUNG|nr:hypothetical protein HK100_003278 [Physocladia obscura]